MTTISSEKFYGSLRSFKLFTRALSIVYGVHEGDYYETANDHFLCKPYATPGSAGEYFLYGHGLCCHFV